MQYTWETLRNHIPAAQNYALMGIPNWNSDIGGYFPWDWLDKGKMKEGYPELYTRWMQHVFSLPLWIVTSIVLSLFVCRYKTPTNNSVGVLKRLTAIMRLIANTRKKKICKMSR